MSPYLHEPDVHWSDRNEWLLSCSLDASLRLWDAQTGKCLRIFRDPTKSSLNCCTFLPSNNNLVVVRFILLLEDLNWFTNWSWNLSSIGKGWEQARNGANSKYLNRNFPPERKQSDRCSRYMPHMWWFRQTIMGWRWSGNLLDELFFFGFINIYIDIF